MLHFDKLQSKVSQWWTFYSDRTRIKSLFRRWKNIGMVFEKLYRNTLSKQFIVFVLYKPQYLSTVYRSILTSSGTHDNLKVFCKCSTSARSLSAWLSRVFAWKKRLFATQCTSNRRKTEYRRTILKDLKSSLKTNLVNSCFRFLTNFGHFVNKCSFTLHQTTNKNFFNINTGVPISRYESVFCKLTFSQKSKKRAKGQIPVIFCLFSTPSVLEKTVTEICMVAENSANRKILISGSEINFLIRAPAGNQV